VPFADGALIVMTSIAGMASDAEENLDVQAGAAHGRARDELGRA
jgi:hypothetical protein